LVPGSVPGLVPATVPGAGAAPGIGNGRGTAPVDAQAPVAAARTKDAMARAYI
jgi:hypothetical protein